MSKPEQEVVVSKPDQVNVPKPEQVLLISPQHELKFRGPFKVPVTSYMSLTNPSDKKVIFKIKTTAPKKYCVRPNSGTLLPKASTKLAICLQPFTFDPNEKSKHKFMVQSLFAPDGEYDIDQIWREINPEQLMDSKLKCVFERVEGVPSPEEEVSPKVAVNESSNSVAPAATNLEAELRSATTEIQELSEEASNLRAENLRLRETMLQMRLENSKASTVGHTKYEPALQEAPTDMIKRIATSVLVIIMGIILGKYVL